jgi:acyl carrier protein
LNDEATFKQIFDEVVQMLVEVLGDDFLLEVEVTPETTFADDLGVESIEFVALAEKMQDRYRGRVNFVAFVGGMDIHEITSMTVGRLVDHILQCVSQPVSTA